MADPSGVDEPTLTPGGLPFLTYLGPEPGKPAVVTSDPPWLQGIKESSKVREHDLERWLVAMKGWTPDDFYSPSYISYRGREFLEHMIHWIVVLNLEEVGSLAWQWIVKSLAWNPHFVSFVMDPNEGFTAEHMLEFMFSPAIIDHYSKALCLKVAEFVWRHFHANRQMYARLTFGTFIPYAFTKDEDLTPEQRLHKKNQTIMHLRRMRIIHEGREIDGKWPAEKFCKGRGKEFMEPFDEAHCHQFLNIPENDQTRLPSGGPSDGNTKENEQPQGSSRREGATGDHKSQAGGAGANDDGGAKASQGGPSSRTVAAGAPGDGSDDSEDEGRKERSRKSRMPSLPKGKKKVDEKDKMGHVPERSELPDAVLNREYLSDDDAEVEKPKGHLSRKDWMNAPGRERRSVSTVSQVELLKDVAWGRDLETLPKISITGRGGRYAVGVVKPDARPPVFTHNMPQDMVLQNNYVYAYLANLPRDEHRRPMEPAHANTTLRGGPHVFQTDPETGRMFVPTQAKQYPTPYGVTTMQEQHAAEIPRVENNLVQRDERAALIYPVPRPDDPISRRTAAEMHPMEMVSQHTAPAGMIPFTNYSPDFGEWSQMDQQPPMGYHQGANQMAYTSNTFTPHIPAPPNMPDFMQRAARRQAAQATPGRQTHAPQLTQRTDFGARGPYTHGNKQFGNKNGPKQTPHQRPTEFVPGAATNKSAATNVTYVPGPYAVPSGSTQAVQASGSGSEPFPKFHDQAAGHQEYAEGQKCSPHTIGPDAEDVDTLWLGDIPKGANTQDLRALIETKVPVQQIRQISYESRSKPLAVGWTFVTFVSNADCRKVINDLQGAIFMGKELKVQVPERRCEPEYQQHEFRQHDYHRKRGSSAYGKPAGQSFQPQYYGIPSGHHQQTSYGGGGHTWTDMTPTRGQQQRGRGNSMAQATSAVRRNSNYTQQDARSDLPMALGSLPQVNEAARPETSHSTATESSGSKGKGKKKKKGNKKPATDNIETDSGAPSDVNVSAPSAPPSEAPSAPVSDSHRTWSQAIQSSGVKTAPEDVKNGHASTPLAEASMKIDEASSDTAVPVEPKDADARQGFATELNQSWSDEVQDQAAKEEAGENANDGRKAVDEAAAEEYDPDDVYSGSPQRKTIQPDATAITALDLPAAETVKDDASVATEQLAQAEEHGTLAVSGTVDALLTGATSVSVNDDASEPSQPAKEDSKAPKQKGEAFTQSFSQFGRKQEPTARKASSKKDKKARQAAKRSISGAAKKPAEPEAEVKSVEELKAEAKAKARKASIGDLEEADEERNDYQADRSEASEDVNTKGSAPIAINQGKGKLYDLDAPDTSDFTNTPVTAKESFNSEAEQEAPSKDMGGSVKDVTNKQEGSTMSKGSKKKKKKRKSGLTSEEIAKQVAENLVEPDEEPDLAGPAKEPKTPGGRGRTGTFSNLFEKMAGTSQTNPDLSLKEQIDTTSQPLEAISARPETARKENSKVPSMSYAQVTKAAGSVSANVGLSERDVNVKP